MFVEIGFLSLIVLVLAGFKLLNHFEAPAKADWQQAEYQSQYSTITLDGKHDATISSIHEREIQLYTEQAKYDQVYRMEQLKRQTDLKIIQWGLLAGIMIIYLATKFEWVKKY